jgi:phosphatidylinositol 4-phosphatase
VHPASASPGSLTYAHNYLAAEYIIIITGREQIGRYLGHPVYKATGFDILPLSANVSVQDPPHPVEGHLLSLVRSHLKTGSFIFSYGADLTRRLQAQHDSREKDEGKALWEIV